MIMKTNLQQSTSKMSEMLEKTSLFTSLKWCITVGYTLFILLFNSGLAVAQTPTTTVFTSSTTWTCPAGVTSVTVECWGGGGGGGGSGATSNGGSGGGSGAYVKKVGIPVTAGTNYTITVGTGGAGGSGFTPTIVATAGNPSWFGSTGTIYARGGCGALGNRGTAGVGGCSGGTTSTCIILILVCQVLVMALIISEQSVFLGLLELLLLATAEDTARLVAPWEVLAASTPVVER